MEEYCFSIVKKPKDFESANELTLKRQIESDDLLACQAAIEELLQNLLDREKFPTNLMMSVINRYQMNRFSRGAGSLDKRIKKLLYILWECLPKRGPDGKFLDKMVMVCGAFDKDLKHPNQYVCGSVLRALSKTREPEVIRELVHSIEKCLEWSHAYQRKNAVLAIAKIYKNFPDLNPSAPKLIAEYLLKETDDECKRAALQALLEIAPEEAKSYLHSTNIPDIHCMNTSIQLLFVELIQRLYKKGNEESETYIGILASLIKQSSSPSVRYQAACALMRFTRDPEIARLIAGCFIDICAKDSDNNVKLVALDSLMKFRRLHGSERVLRSSIMDILSILQSATDSELHEKILKLSLDLVSPLNVSGIVSALGLELKKMQKSDVLSSPQDSVKYRRLLVETVHKISERFPQVIVDCDILDTLLDLLSCNTIGDRTSTRIVWLLKVLIMNNPKYSTTVLKNLQKYFNLANDNITAHCGLIQLLGDFSLTKDQIETSYRIIQDSLGELPILAAERRKQAERDESGTNDDSTNVGNRKPTNGEIDGLTKSMKQLVTADGSYATQSAINYHTKTSTDDKQTPLRAFLLKNKFEIVTPVCFALVKMACRYQQSNASKAECDKLIARFMFAIASILNVGHSNLMDHEGNQLQLNNYHTENLMLSLNILQKLAENATDVTHLLKKVITVDMPSQQSSLIKKLGSNETFERTLNASDKKETRFDDAVTISLFANNEDDLEQDRVEEVEDLQHITMPEMFAEIPLTGTIDPIYAYCKFHISQYDLGLALHLENRTKTKTFQNVTVELCARKVGDPTSTLFDRPEPVVLAPRATACIRSNIKIVSAENRRLFGCIVFDDAGSDAKEQIIVLNDIGVNISDYIKPATISFDDFRDLWRECEWENKVVVKTKLTNLKEYLINFVTTINMRCLTAERYLNGKCSFLSANLYARSALGEEALVNVSLDKATPNSPINGSIKIRSRSQGMALGIGEKVTALHTDSAV